MIFFRIVFILLVMLLANSSFADDNTQNQEVVDQVKEITKNLQEDEEVPLNDPFAGNEGNNSSGNIPEGEQENEMSLYNFKLAGLISGKDHSYISLVNASGEVITLTLGQYLGKIQLIDLRLTEAIFKKEDSSYMILDFNNQIREADEY
jgi:Tfp pilus assembly protein PilP|tara:strand:+ start:44 stop:490 length:447 start_codon:yes stop_codon:yes gene_type:complete